MKIAWFTPYSSRSAIGRYSQLVTTHLANRHEVEIFTFCSGDLHPATVPVHQIDPKTGPVPLTGDYDVAVYQMGNYWPFHGEIWRQSQRYPGIVVLHDCVMHGFFASYFFEELKSVDAYAFELERLYGQAGADAAMRVKAGEHPPLWETDEVAKFPMVELVTERALGVASHSKFVIRGIEKKYLGPTLSLPLAYQCVGADDAPPFTREALNVQGDELLVVTVGHVNPNKRVHNVIRSLGNLPGSLKRRVVYAILGPVSDEYREFLIENAAAAGLTARVRLNGYTSNEELASYLAHADLCVNLRYPNTEGASASLIEQLLAGKPVIASNTGWFAELPDDVVRHVSIDQDGDLTRALVELLSDESDRLSLGERAREYAKQTFAADLYGQELERFIESVQRLTGIHGFTDVLSDRMARMGADADSEWARSIAALSSKLFAEVWAETSLKSL